jgi:LysM repeat protein
MRTISKLWLVGALCALATGPNDALAQDAGGAAPPGAPPIPDGANVTVYQTPGSPPPPPPDAPSVNAHLPSSAGVSTDTSKSADGFDLTGSARGGSSTVRGKAGGAYIVSGQSVPNSHQVKRGDTLWGISQRYFGNPYNWPRVWAYNNQIQNPHWLYPGDQLRLKRNVKRRSDIGFVRPEPTVPPNAVFLRNFGFVRDDEVPMWGEIVGSPDDQMLLSENDRVYIQMDDKRDVQVGQTLTLFEPNDVKDLTSEDLVWIRGVAKVDRYNPKSKMARALIVESFDTIERGVRVGPVDRAIDVVKPVRNKKEVRARIVGALYPHEFYATEQVVFIDKGSEHGIEIGNRFFAVSRGDAWRQGLKNAGRLSDDRAMTEDDAKARTEETPDDGDDAKYPAETYAELMVVRVRKKTATVMVTASTHEIGRGALVIMRPGY